MDSKETSFRKQGDKFWITVRHLEYCAEYKQGVEQKDNDCTENDDPCIGGYQVKNIGPTYQDHVSDYKSHSTSIGCLSTTKPDGNSIESNSNLTENEITYTEENINPEFSSCSKQVTKC